MATGCNTAANAPTVTSAAPAATSTATSTPAATATPAATPTATPTAAPSPSPLAAPDFTVNSDGFQLYNLVKLGMTKDEVDKATGQAGETQSDYDKQNSIFTYTDSQARGVKVTFNDQKKAYAKEVFYNDTASVLGPLNSVPVTKAQSKKIKKGMAYVDVVKLLGSNGTVGCVTADKSDCMSHLALNRFWGNKDGSFIEVDFTPGNTVNSINYAPYQPE